MYRRGPKAMHKYHPEIFVVSTIEQAKAIILTPEPGTTTEQRWAHETPILADQLLRDLAIQATDLVLDYGCGIGRLAKALIERRQCAIVGVDISVSMTQLAPGYTSS